MKENHIIVNKTARFYTLGDLNQKTKQVWIVLHGWGQNAKDFLAQLEPLLQDEIFFIAPEALNRFYLRDTSGKVGATWMTREDRLNEIKDYIHYLDEVYEHFELESISAEVTALGFSQGSSTVTRWINATGHKVDRLIVFAGEVAPELFPLSQHSGLKRTENFFICGTDDEYFTPELVRKMKENYREMNFTEIEFKGKHILDLESLNGFLQISKH